MTRQFGSRTWCLLKYAIYSLLALGVLLPLLYVVLNSVTPLEDIGKYVFFPRRLSLRNFQVVLFQTPFFRYMKNTVFLAVVITAGNALLCSMAAYGFARIRFPGRQVFFMIIVATLVIPGEVLIIPQYVLVSALSWVDSYLAIIMPALASAFNIFFLRQYFLGLPAELDESARIDGCGRHRIYWSILLPLVKTPLITVSLLTFFGVWDGFLWPLTVINSPEKHVLQVAISLLNTETFTDIGAQFSNVVLSSLPIVVLFLCMQKYYVAGITSGAVKE